MLVWFWAAAARAQCADTGALLDTLERTALEGRLDLAEEASARLVETFACGDLAQPSELARMWLAEALILAASGEPEAADDALAAAARISPATWDDRYGLAQRQRWDAASRRAAAESGRVDIGELPPGYVGAVDGAILRFPATLAPGLHLLQVGDEEVVAAMRFELPSGLDLVLALSLPVDDSPPLAEHSDPMPRIATRDTARKRRINHGLALGLSSVALLGVSVALVGNDSRHSDDLDVAGGFAGLSAVGLGVASGTVLTIGLATPKFQEL